MMQSHPSSEGTNCDSTFTNRPPAESDNITCSAHRRDGPRGSSSAVFLTDGSPLSDWTYVFHGSTGANSVYLWKTYVSLTLLA